MEFCISDKVISDKSNSRHQNFCCILYLTNSGVKGIGKQSLKANYIICPQFPVVWFLYYYFFFNSRGCLILFKTNF